MEGSTSHRCILQPLTRSSNQCSSGQTHSNSAAQAPYNLLCVLASQLQPLSVGNSLCKAAHQLLAQGSDSCSLYPKTAPASVNSHENPHPLSLQAYVALAPLACP